MTDSSSLTGDERQSRRMAEISRLESGWLDGEGQKVSRSVITLALTVAERPEFRS